MGDRDVQVRQRSHYLVSGFGGFPGGNNGEEPDLETFAIIIVKKG